MIAQGLFMVTGLGLSRTFTIRANSTPPTPWFPLSVLVTWLQKSNNELKKLLRSEIKLLEKRQILKTGVLLPVDAMLPEGPLVHTWPLGGTGLWEDNLNLEHIYSKAESLLDLCIHGVRSQYPKTGPSSTGLWIWAFYPLQPLWMPTRDHKYFLSGNECK